MTTVVFNGKMLVADSRRSNGFHSEDDVIKVHKVEDRHYKGERILAIAGAGTVTMIEATISAFLEDPDGFEERLRGFERLFTAARRKFASCTVLFITDRQAYRISNIPDSPLRVCPEFREPYPDLLAKGEFVFTAIGSGGSMATAFHKTFNLPLPVCVGLLSGIRKSGTGGILTIIEFDDGKLTRYGAKVYESYDMVYAEALEHLKSSECRHLGIIPDIFGSVVGKTRSKAANETTKAKPKKAAAKKTAKKAFSRKKD